MVLVSNGSMCSVRATAYPPNIYGLKLGFYEDGQMLRWLGLLVAVNRQMHLVGASGRVYAITESTITRTKNRAKNSSEYLYRLAAA